MRNHVTVIPQDNLIIVDGIGYQIDCSSVDKNIHAIQWHDGCGHCEYEDETPNKELSEADYEEYVSSFVALWESKDARLKEEEAKALEEYNSPENVQKRLQKQYTDYIQSYLDAEAQKLGYDSCLSVCSYVNTGVAKFDKEGEAFRTWRSLVWNKGYELLDSVLTGEIEIPSYEELVELLPKLEIVY